MEKDKDNNNTMNTTGSNVKMLLRDDGKLLIGHDPDEPTVTIPIAGNGSAPVIVLDPYYYDFGTTLIGCEGEKEVIISNVGDVDLVVSTLDFYVSYPAEMEISLHEDINGPLPWTIPPGIQKMF